MSNMGGLVGTDAPLRRVVRRCRYEVFRKRVEHANRLFDQAWGTDTSVAVGIDDLDVDEAERVDANDYECMHAGTLLRILTGLGVELDGYEFVDLGSGKGKAVLVAATRPFKRVTGVELSDHLHRVAVENIARFEALGGRRSGEMRSVCQNAARFRTTHPDVVVFMLNPFGAAVLRQVVIALDEHLADSSRRGIVLYSNPVHRDVLDTSTTLDPVFRARRLAVYSTPAAGLDPSELRRRWGTSFDGWGLGRDRVTVPLHQLGPTATETGSATP